MQRAAFPELQGRPRTRHRRQNKPDGVLIFLKFATLIVACGLVAVVILLTGGTDGPRPVAAPPKASTGQTGDDAPGTSTMTPPSSVPVMAPPELRTEVAEITRVAPATTSKAPRPSPTPQNPPQNFAVVGHPCPDPGMWSVTANYEPVFCYGNSPPRWRKVF